MDSPAFNHFANVHDHPCGWLAHLVHLDLPGRLIGGQDFADIRNLTARFYIETGLGQQNFNLIARLHLIYLNSIFH